MLHFRLESAFPKGSDFSKVSAKELKRVQDLLNERPRKVLGYENPRDLLKCMFENPQGVLSDFIDRIEPARNNN